MSSQRRVLASHTLQSTTLNFQHWPRAMESSIRLRTRVSVFASALGHDQNVLASAYTPSLLLSPAGGAIF